MKETPIIPICTRKSTDKLHELPALTPGQQRLYDLLTSMASRVLTGEIRAVVIAADVAEGDERHTGNAYELGDDGEMARLVYGLELAKNRLLTD